MSVAEHIIALLEGDRAARNTAAWELRALRFDPKLLVPVLEHPHVSRQVKAIELLRYSRTREAVELLVGMLASPHALVGRKAASRLGNIGSIAPELIVAALDTATTAEHRLNILDALSRLQHPYGREVLLVHADAWEPHLRVRALDYLRRYRDDVPVDAIRAALGDREVQHAAAEIAGRLRDPSFLEPLLDVCLAGDDWAHWESGWAAAKYGGELIEPLLARAVDPTLHRRIARVLGRAMWRIDEAQFWRLWTCEIDPIHDECLLHLSSPHARAYDRARCMAALAEHVHDVSRDRRFSCLHAYRSLGAIEAIQALTEDPDEGLRERARSTLRALANGPG